MTETPTFKNPPVVEFVLGVQFSPLTKLVSGHYGLLWKELGSDWENPEDAPPINEQFELFDSPKWSHREGVQFRLGKGMPTDRFILHHRRRDRLIQVQPTRFHLNWRTSGELKPSYKVLISKFEEAFSQFERFVRVNELGKLELNQWEITYIDSFPQGDDWQTPGDWSRFLPGLFGDLFTAPGLALENRAAQWSFEIQPKRGRVHIAAQVGRWRDQEKDSLLVDTTARGLIGKGGATTLREGLDLGHDVSVQSFLAMTSDDIKRRWE
jgi:uncharacterized protein (TIGR04255 family)